MNTVTEKEALFQDCCVERDYRCVASKCMAWRWLEPKPDAPAEPTGFCGLAGDPSIGAAWRQQYRTKEAQP